MFRPELTWASPNPHRMFRSRLNDAYYHLKIVELKHFLSVVIEVIECESTNHVWPLARYRFQTLAL